MKISFQGNNQNKSLRVTRATEIKILLSITHSLINAKLTLILESMHKIEKFERTTLCIYIS